MISDEARNRNFDHARTLTDEQDAIGSICLTFLHSFSDDDACPPVYFHPQVIADARTVVEMINMVRPHLLKHQSTQVESQGLVSRVLEFFRWLQRLIKKGHPEAV